VNKRQEVFRVGSCSIAVKIRTLVRMRDNGWECAAFGPNSGIEECYMSGGHYLFECPTEHLCRARMKQERQRVWQQLQHLAATDEFWEGIAEFFENPDTLLNGPQSADDNDASS
jgi:hypothetical protein